ncbi:KAP family P-loop NTPase fold protein [Pseudomonas yangonensis]|uniref:KAP family P-loop NTPase fold protein n=1 Tax=Pseudomonas yangonensis TaxID=2579922 RepID=UPI00137A5622|nr:P-loop NTPase fold protein [Pseudomonas yangonensis]
MTQNILAPHNEPQKRSCFNDQPITSHKDDHLKNNQYAKGLLQFIKIADAPITIGIQGGWGSGKTSLINLLQHELEKSGDSLCINVNAWQQSLFANSGKSGEIALSLLDSAYEELKEQIIEKGKSGKLKINEEQKQNIIRLGSTVVRLTAAFAGIPLPASGESAEKTQQRPSRAFKRLRQDMSDAIRSLISDKSNRLERIVIFVDDLDRIQPETAVEVLDVLKNVFDIEHCISVLAIDYDVVIKGLRKKFGEQGKNQREFRQYFDKIIQIPFSMPVGNYHRNIPHLLERLIETVLPGTVETANRELFIKSVTDIVVSATDGVPRSIKRIVNTVSLLSIIDSSPQEDTDKTSHTATASKELQFKILLAVVCLQVSFPDIHKALSRLPNIEMWDDEAPRTIWQLSTMEEHDQQREILEDEFNYDECSWQSPLLELILHYELTAKAIEIRDIIWELNDLAAEPGGLQALRKTLRSTNITETDSADNQVPSPEITKEDAHKHCRNILDTLLEHIGEDRLGRIHGRKTTKENEDEWTLEHTGKVNYPIRPDGLEQIDIVLHTENTLPRFTIYFLIPKAKLNPTLLKHISDAGFYEPGLAGWFGINLPQNPSSGLEPNIEGFHNETLPRIRKLLDILG